MSRWGRAIGVLALVAGVVACDSSDDATKDGLFVLPYEGGLDAAIASRPVIITATACAYTPLADGDALLLAFSRGAELARDPNRVVLPDGSEVIDGETYDFGGGGMDQAELELPQLQPTYEATVEACRRSGVTDLAPGALWVASVHPVGWASV